MYQGTSQYVPSNPHVLSETRTWRSSLHCLRTRHDAEAPPPKKKTVSVPVMHTLHQYRAQRREGVGGQAHPSAWHVPLPEHPPGQPAGSIIPECQYRPMRSTII
eukprot:1918634-Rhodomonas_salina.3